MRPYATLIAGLLFVASFAGAAEKPIVTVERVRADLARVRPQLEKLTGLAWPDELPVEVTDPAGLYAVLYEEFLRDVAILYPDRPESSRRLLAEMLARSFARVVRAKYGLITKKIHVVSTAVDGLPEGLDKERVLTFILAHEAVHAMDDRAFDLSATFARAPDAEAHRALRMVVEGRAEHYSAKLAPILGIPAKVDEALTARRDDEERMVRDAGRRFVAALAARDPALLAKSMREPPRTTSIVFHPDRYGRPFEPPDAAAPLTAAKLGGTVLPLSELRLRKLLASRLKTGDVERMFAGYLAGASVATPDELTVSLTEHDGADTARAFLTGLMAFEGQAANEEATWASGSLKHPDGRSFKWWAWRRGTRVMQVVGPAGTDVAKRVGPALAPTPKKK